MPKQIRQAPASAAPTPVQPGESWRQYIDRLRQSPNLGAPEMAGIMAASALMRNRPDSPADAEMTRNLSNRLMKQPSLRQLARDPAAKTLAREGGGAELLIRMEKRQQLEQSQNAAYQRPEGSAEADARFLRTAMRSMRDSFAGRSPVQREREGKRFLEFLRRMDHARALAEKGIPLSGRTARELSQAAQRYNDGGSRQPGGKGIPAASKEALCVMKRFMPEKEFEGYCSAVNQAQQAQNPAHRRHLSSKDYTEDLLNGQSRSARDLMLASQKRLAKGATVDGCATVAAILRLSGGNPNAVIRKEALENEVARLKSPGSAFLRAMSDEKAREKFSSLAAQGKVVQLGRTLLQEANLHTARAAQWQINQSIRTAGASNSPADLARILAARELAASKDPSQPITNGAFQKRAEEISKTPGFNRMADRYRNDAAFRSSIQRSFSTGDGGKKLEQAYREEQSPSRSRESLSAVPAK